MFRIFRILMINWIFICIFLSCFSFIDSACTNPLPISSGTWKTSSRGTWTVNGAQTVISDFEVTTSATVGPFTVTMKCEDDSDADGYIQLKSQNTYNIFGGPKYVYACVKFEQQTTTTTNAYYFYLGTSITVLATGVYERIVLLPTSVAYTYSQFCTDKARDPDRTHVAIKDGEEANSAITCPTSIHGTFSYSDTSCTTTFLDVCTTLTLFNFNYTACSEHQLFSESGQLYCVYSGTNNGYNYLTLYNNDTSPVSSTYYQYSCLVYTTADKIVTASIQPKECYGNSFQTPTATNHPSGVTRTFTNYGDSSCYLTTTMAPNITTDNSTAAVKQSDATSESSLLWLYILIAIIILIIIIAIIIIVYCCLKRKKKKQQKKADEESLHPSDSEEQQLTEEEQKKRDEEQRPTSPVKEEDRASIDSGIEQEKKEEPKPPPAEKGKKVVIGDCGDNVGTKEDKKEEKDKEEVQQTNDNEDNIISDQTKTIENETESLKDNSENIVPEDNKFENSVPEDNKSENIVSEDKKSENIVPEDNNSEQEKIINEIVNEQSVKNNSNENFEQNDMIQTDKQESKNVSENEETEDKDNFEQNNVFNEPIETEDDKNHNIKDESVLSTCQEEDKLSQKSNDNEIIEKSNHSINENETKNISNDEKLNDEIIPQNAEGKNKKESNIENTKNDEKEEAKVSDKESLNVKIYETKELDENEDQNRRDKDSGDTSTEQKATIINVAEKDKEKEKTEDEEQEGSSSGDESESSSRVTTPDPEEIERNIRKIGMKKSTNFTPQGKLSKVLVSREMEEKSRTNKERGKWKKMKNLFQRKTKKIQAVQQNKDGKEQRESTPDSDEKKGEKNVAPFMKEYHYKKDMENRLDEQHVWGGEPDYTKKKFEYSDEEEFEDIFKDEQMKDEPEKAEQTKVEKITADKKHDETIKDEQAKKRKQQQKNDQKKEQLTELEKAKKKQMIEDQGKDSGVDSPDFKREKTDIKLTDDEQDMEQMEMTEPPPGYIRDSTGQIIRLYDGKVMTQEEMQFIFPTAKLGMLFHVPRLKRTSHGRPTGDYIEDTFGPQLEKDNDSIRNADLRDEHSKPKHPRSSKGSARRNHKDFTTKTVAFDMDDGNSDILMIEDEDDRNSQIEKSLADRDLLRKRLFRNKRKPRSRGTSGKMYLSDESRPRELSDLVRVIPQNNGSKYAVNGRAAIPGTVVSRSDSMKNKFDPEQQRLYREGLATDKRILDGSSSFKQPGAPREAFVDQDPDDITVSIENEENEYRQRRNENGINIGSDDEFFLVGNNQGREERLFTRVARPGQTTVRPLPGGQDNFCHKHDMRHALPWSLINQYQIRESSILDVNSIAKKHAGPKSADNVKRSIDDRRLRELLEELYKDKKYFDHVIDTTEPNAEPIIDERDLAEHGRGFLLERAEYWDERGVLPPRPPQTALGLRLSRMNTNIIPDSGRVSNISYASTVTPVPPPEHLPQRDELPQAFNKENTIS